MKPIEFFHTHVSQSASERINETLATTFLSEGRINRDFEAALSEVIQNPHVVTVNSGTSALHLALVISGVSEGDEVILPAQTFIASGLAVTYCKARPVFADIDLSDGNLDPDAVESAITNRTKAIMPVHWAGKSANMDAIRGIAQHHNLRIIEDAAHAFGGSYSGQKIGQTTDLCCFSFQAIKHLTTGDGGMIAFSNEEDLEHAKRLRWFGIDRVNHKTNELGERQYLLEAAGYKYHMNDLAASLGLANLQGWEQRLSRRRQIARQYANTLQKIEGIQPLSMSFDEDAFWLFGTVIEKRSDFIQRMKSFDIPVSVVHQGIHKHPLFQPLSTELPNQKAFDAQQIHLPIHEGLAPEQVDYICSKLLEGW